MTENKLSTNSEPNIIKKYIQISGVKRMNACEELMIAFHKINETSFKL